MKLDAIAQHSQIQASREASIGEFGLDMWWLNDTAQAFFESCGLKIYRLFLRKETVPKGKMQGEELLKDA